MNTKKILAIISTILAILLIIGVSTFAGPCPVVEGQKPMKCVWTAEATKGIGIVMAVTALIRIFLNDNKINIGLSIVEVLNAIYTIALPTVLIGTCMNTEMVCNTTMKPFILLVAGIYGILSIVNIFLNRN